MNETCYAFFLYTKVRFQLMWVLQTVQASIYYKKLKGVLAPPLRPR